MKRRGKLILSICYFLLLGLLIGFNFFIADNTVNKIEISSVEDFERINEDLDGNYILTNSLVIERHLTIGDAKHPFTGTLDGNYIYTITLKNVLVDDLDDNYIYDGSYCYGLFPYNKGVIIHCNFNFDSYEFDVSNAVSNIYCGCISGINEGKITTCNVSSSTGDIKVSLSSFENITFGLFAGKNIGNIKNSTIYRNVNLSLFSKKIFVGGFAGQICGKNSNIDMCEKKGWLIFSKISDNAEIASGSFVGLASGGSISNCYGGKTNVGFSFSSSMSSSLNLIMIGGFVGYYDGLDDFSILNSCYIGSAASSYDKSPSTICYAGSLIGFSKADLSKLKIENTLAGGYCNISAPTKHTTDIGVFDDGVSVNVLNSYYINDFIKYKYSESSFILPEKAMSDLSINNLHWDGSIWSISENEIVFKPGL